MLTIREIIKEVVNSSDTESVKKMKIDLVIISLLGLYETGNYYMINIDYSDDYHIIKFNNILPNTEEALKYASDWLWYIKYHPRNS